MFPFAHVRLARLSSFAFTLACLLPLNFATAKTGEAEVRAAIDQQANECAQAALHGDYETLAARLHPRLVEMMGGRDAFIRQMKASAASMTNASPLPSVTIGRVERFLVSGGQYFAIVPETLTKSVANGQPLQQRAYLIGISDDQGLNWHFIDAAAMKDHADELHHLFPNLPPSLTPPPSATPIDPSTPDAARIDRAAFQLRLPAGASVDPPKGDPDHYVSIKLPAEVRLAVMMIDQPQRVAAVFDNTLSICVRTLTMSTTMPSHFCDRFQGKATLVTGTLLGDPYCYETGQFTVGLHAFVLTASYPKDNAPATRAMLNAIVDSFTFPH